MPDQDALEKFKLIYSSYNEINGLDRYEDEKAQRGLQALAFISLSGVTIFAASLYILSSLSKQQTLLFLTYIFFGIFIILISVGTFLILFAIRPSFIPLEHQNKGIPESLYFYKEVADFDKDKWNNYLNSTAIDDLLEKATSDLINETHVIAKKIGRKVKNTTWGFNFYLYSVVFMAIMSVTMLVLAAKIV